MKKIDVIGIPGSNYSRLTSWIKSIYPTSDVNIIVDSASFDSESLIIIPGNGSYDFHLNWLSRQGLDVRLIDSESPVIGICSGAHIMMKSSEESINNIVGLGLINGHVKRLSSNILNIGFRKCFSQKSQDTFYAYFCHNFKINLQDQDVDYTSTTYCQNEIVPAVVRSSTKIGIQFHPEMSGDSGRVFFQKLVSQLNA